MSDSAPMTLRIPGKWVLAGEHAVLRGGSAVVFPHAELALTLTFTPSESGLEIRTESEPDVDGVRRTLESLQSLATPGAGLLAGKIEISSTIPRGAGAGSSAALCVALVRALGPRLGIEESRYFAVARELENLFHGQSSGMDVAAVLHASAAAGVKSGAGPVRFSVSRGARPLAVHARYQAQPLRFEFIDTGLRARTADCVAQVNALRLKDPGAEAIDVKMAGAAEHAAYGLEQGDPAAVADAMNAAQECFDAWGLTPAPIAQMIRNLRASGARGVKLTGSGGGGMLVVLR